MYGGQENLAGTDSLLPSGGQTQGQTGCQTWQQMPLPAEPSQQAYMTNLNLGFLEFAESYQPAPFLQAGGRE